MAWLLCHHRHPPYPSNNNKINPNGLVLRVNDPQERRQILLSLTSAGGKYQQQVYQALLTCIEQRLNSLFDQHNSQIIAGLLLLESIFSEADNGDRSKNP